MNPIDAAAPSSDALHAQLAPLIYCLTSQRLARFGGQCLPDVVQDVWVDVVVAHREGDALDREQIATLVERHVKRLKRSRIREDQCVGPDVPNADATATVTSPEGAQPFLRPDRAYEAWSLAASAHRILRDALSERQYEIFCRRVGEGHTVVDTASRLRLSKAVVKNELSRGARRARLALRSELGQGPSESGASPATLTVMVHALSAASGGSGPRGRAA